MYDFNSIVRETFRLIVSSLEKEKRGNSDKKETTLFYLWLGLLVSRQCQESGTTERSISLLFGGKCLPTIGSKKKKVKTTLTNKVWTEILPR